MADWRTPEARSAVISQMVSLKVLHKCEEALKMMEEQQSRQHNSALAAQGQGQEGPGSMHGGGTGIGTTSSNNSIAAISSSSSSSSSSPGNIKIAAPNMTTATVTATSSEATPPPPPPSASVPPPVPSPKATPTSLKFKSMMDFRIIPSPPPRCTNLEEVVTTSLFPDNRLPPSKRICLKEKPKLSPMLRRELMHLMQFSVRCLPNENQLDSSLTLECSTADDGLATVPPLIVKVPERYPNASPEYQMKGYDKSPFLFRVKKLLLDKCAFSWSTYTLSSLLRTWESCILQAMTIELS